MSYSYKLLLCALLLFVGNTLKAIEVLQFPFPSSLAGKVMVAYWANSNDYECYFFKNENDYDINSILILNLSINSLILTPKTTHKFLENKKLLRLNNGD